MCGIAGTLSPDKRLPLEQVPAALEMLAHRGPDDVGWLCFNDQGTVLGRRWSMPAVLPELVLLHRRLSIIDCSENGWQPMVSADGGLAVVFNGEIYNHVELRETLAAAGHVFRSTSDTEVLLAAWQQWGPAALPRLVGMFAFAIFDKVQRKLFLARDAFGIKPLYYVQTGTRLTFASELRTLLLLESGTSRAVDPDRLFLYLRYGISDQGSGTLFSSVRQLTAAHVLTVPLDLPQAATLCRFWTPTPEQLGLSFDEAAIRLRDLFIQSVKWHLRSDVPVGAAVSGGIDSSCIVAVAREVQPHTDLHTFSYISDDPTLSEEHWVDCIAQSKNVCPHKVCASADGLLADMRDLVDAQEEPFTSTSLYSQYQVFKEAKKAGIKVMLDGQGADELFAGYRYHVAARAASLMLNGRWKELFRVVHYNGARSRSEQLSIMQKAIDYKLPRLAQQALRAVIGKDLVPEWAKASWFRAHGVGVDGVDRSFRPDILHETLLRDITQNSLPHLLRYEDRNSMAFSIESRVPFLTPELANFALSVPEEYLIDHDGTSKALLRRAMRGLVPDSILDRKDKIGFVTPEREWLRALDGPWIKSMLERARDIPVLDFRRICDDWNGVRGHASVRYGKTWRWLNLVSWSTQFNVQYC